MTEVTKPKKRVKKDPVHYVDNKRLYEALVEYKAQPEPRQITNEIGLAIMKICKGLSFAYNFRSYSYRDEMVDDGVENVIYAVPFFDPEKSKVTVLVRRPMSTPTRS